MSNLLHPGYILHRRPYSNSSLLLECFTRDHGIFPAIARGGGSGRSGRSGILQPFNPLLLSWRGKGEIVTLGTVEPRGMAAKLTGTSLICGFYVNELITRLVQRHDPHPELFENYHQVLDNLNSSHTTEPVLRNFELFLLHQIGYAIQLEYDAQDGSPVCADAIYEYVIEKGAVKVCSETPDSISGKTLIALSDGIEKHPAQWREARNLTRRVLNHYLGDKPLKSRELFR